MLNAQQGHLVDELSIYEPFILYHYNYLKWKEALIVVVFNVNLISRTT